MQIVSHYEREKIEYYVKLKMSIRAIARRLKRDHSVISRELERNSCKGTYIAREAHKKASLKTRKTNKRKLETNGLLHDYVEKKLKSGWSPELIAGRLKEHPLPELKKATISHEQIYEYIYEGEGRWEGWWHYLHRARPKRRQRRARNKKPKIHIVERISIDRRPDIINQRKRFGDWETDLAVFKKQKEGLAVQYERKAMLTRIHKVKNKTAEESKEAIVKSIDTLPQHLFKSLTFDNGGENVCHVHFRKEFGIETYFCDTYAAWQKGGVENTIGLIRRYLPRETNLSKITDEDITAIQEAINNRPRKKLHFLTPNEALSREINLWGGALNF